MFVFGSVLEWSHYYNKYLYVAVWICNGLLQSSGWPTVVAIMGNWFGRSRLVHNVFHSHNESMLINEIIQLNWVQVMVKNSL